MAKEIIYPKLSYKVIGVLFEVNNELGSGHREQTLQKAVGILLKAQNIPFQEQVPVPIIVNQQPITKYFIDFLIDHKIILELKVQERFDRKSIQQLFDYMGAIKVRLGILVIFTHYGVRFRRFVLHDSKLR